MECVATGVEHNAREVAQIALVDEYERCLLNVYVRPPPGATVHSYLTPLTGLTAEIIDAHGVTLAEAVASVRAALPKHAVLVGQNIAKDVQWLGLIEGQDFQGMVDLAGVWRVWNPRFNTWSVFGQDHLVRVLLGAEFGAQHNAALDALKSVIGCSTTGGCARTRRARGAPSWRRPKQALLNAPPEPSFAKKNPSFEGCCMGNRKTCTCGAPFLG